MSIELDRDLRNTGTRFRIFPQPAFLGLFSRPETICVSVPPHRIQDGPGDDRMFVVDAVSKRPYDAATRPPYGGPFNAKVRRGADGHFDTIPLNTRQFSCAALYASVRRVLDIWEDYFGHRVEWHFETQYARLELIPLVDWDNAQSGYGFLELGYAPQSSGGFDRKRPYCENFDVIAHEIGHALVTAEMGVPTSSFDDAIDYGGVQESSADLVAIISALHFDSLVERLLDSTRGNLFTVNELDRVGELSKTEQIRIAFNSYRMPDVGTEPHERSLPLTGGVFDVLVEIFQKKLVERGLITRDLAERSTQGPDVEENANTEAVQADFDRVYFGNEAEFKCALLEARDCVGRLLATAWTALDANFLTYHTVLRRLMRADRKLANDEGREPEHQETIRSCFAWREIAPGPASPLLRVRRLSACLHAKSATTLPGERGVPC
jgi:hypothetical protein